MPNGCGGFACLVGGEHDVSLRDAVHSLPVLHLVLVYIAGDAPCQQLRPGLLRPLRQITPLSVRVSTRLAAHGGSHGTEAFGLGSACRWRGKRLTHACACVRLLTLPLRWRSASSRCHLQAMVSDAANQRLRNVSCCA